MIKVLEIIEERRMDGDVELHTYLVDRDKAVALLADTEADIRYTRYIVEDALAGHWSAITSDKYSFGDTDWEAALLAPAEGAETEIVHSMIVEVGG